MAQELTTTKLVKMLKESPLPEVIQQVQEQGDAKTMFEKQIADLEAQMAASPSSSRPFLKAAIAELKRAESSVGNPYLPLLTEAILTYTEKAGLNLTKSAGAKGKLAGKSRIRTNAAEVKAAVEGLAAAGMFSIKEVMEKCGCSRASAQKGIDAVGCEEKERDGLTILWGK